MLALFVTLRAWGQQENLFSIIANNCPYQQGAHSLTGFRLKGQAGIVTALHGVVGCSVKAQSDGQVILRQKLDILAVDVAADIALLSSSELRRLPDQGFRSAPAARVLGGAKVTVWGHPLGVTLKNTNLTVRRPPIELLRTFLTDPDLRERMLQRDSPSPKLGVLSLDGILLPGDSGAPILDDQGRVIGVANGGLQGGLGGLNWAIPIDSIDWQRADGNQRLNQLKHMNSSLFSFQPLKKPTKPDTFTDANSIVQELSELAASNINPYSTPPDGEYKTFVKLSSSQACVLYVETRRFGGGNELTLKENLEARYFGAINIMYPDKPPIGWKLMIRDTGSERPYYRDVFAGDEKTATRLKTLLERWVDACNHR